MKRPLSARGCLLCTHLTLQCNHVVNFYFKDIIEEIFLFKYRSDVVEVAMILKDEVTAIIVVNYPICTLTNWWRWKNKSFLIFCLTAFQCEVGIQYF